MGMGNCRRGRSSGGVDCRLLWTWVNVGYGWGIRIGNMGNRMGMDMRWVLVASGRGELGVGVSELLLLLFLLLFVCIFILTFSLLKNLISPPTSVKKTRIPIKC